MINTDKTQNIILNLIQPITEDEIINLQQGVSRIIAKSVISKLDFPHWDNSAMDGYAVRYEDIKNAVPEHPIRLNIVEEIPAGYQPKKEVKKHEAARIFTGAVMPNGADTIVIQEDTNREGNEVIIYQSSKYEEFVRKRGSFYRAGNSLLSKGIMLNPPEIAILAAVQCSEISVYRRPRVAILSTGDELVNPEQPLKIGQIVDSNQYALIAWVQQMGCIPIPLGIVPDNHEKLTTAMVQAIASADVVLSTGGVSVGDYDYVERILSELGGSTHINSVAIKPGKPLTVASFEQQGKKVIYFGLPGNPVSALVSCWRFVQPAINKLKGLGEEYWQPKIIEAITLVDLRADGKRETYLWGRISLGDRGYQFQLASGSHNSANLINLAQTNGLAIVPIGVNNINSGETIQVLITS